MNIVSLDANLPLLDISIVTYNSAKWLDKFFDSILAQIYPKNLINIFITDHNSSDDTLKFCHAFQNKYANLLNSIQIFERPNLGFGCGHNHNLKQGNAAYFLVTNVDLELANDAILKCINMAVSDDEDVASWEFRQKPFEHPKFYNPVTLETDWSAHACTLFRRSAIEYVKGYEEKIFLYGEDVELSYRLRDKGFRLKYCPASVCWHYTYEYANQVKKLQFLGSTLANSYIRLRYGSWKQILAIPLMYLKLWLSPPCIENQRLALLHNFGKVLHNSLYFLNTRKQSNKSFPINGWDYGLIRDGAFYAYPQQIIPSLPLVSVIMRTYKGRLPYLKESVKSVLNQTYPHIELVVVEDGSDEAKNYLEQINNISRLKVIYRSEPKNGRCHTGNVGLSLSTGKFIVFLDDDDLFFPDHIEVLAHELLSHPEVAATYSISWEVSIKLLSLEPLSYIEVLHQVIYKQPFSRLLMLHHNYIPIQSILFDRKLYDRYGGFDASLDNLEDWNLWTRYCSEDKFLLIEKTTSMYRISDDFQERIARQESLNSYYSLAVEKQKQLSFTITREELMDFYQNMVNYEKIPITYNKSKIKSLLSKFKILKQVYDLLFFLNYKRKRIKI